jgi:hypothetical protein
MADWRKSKAGDNVDKGSGSKSGATSKPRVSGGMSSGDAGASATEKTHNVEFAKGGSTKMFGEQAANSQKSATTAHDVSGGAPGPEFASGGKTKMFGFQGALPARDGITSAR